MNRSELKSKYPELHEEIEYKDVIYQRHIYQNNLPYLQSWLNDCRRPYRTLEQSIWNYLELKSINHRQAQEAFFALMNSYYGFQLPGDTDYQEFDLLELANS